MSYTYKNVYVGFNYKNIEDTKDEDAIYIETGQEHGEDDFIAISVDEALWLSEKLAELAKEINENPVQKAKKLIEEAEKILEDDRMGWQLDLMAKDLLSITKELIEYKSK